jgi:phosphate transport system substrate-binding protein
MMISQFRIVLASAGAALGVAIIAYAAAPITGAGSTAAAPVYGIWAARYEKETQVQLNYDAVGSGAGLARIRERKVNFGASDVPLSLADATKDGLVAIPTVVTAAVPVVNISGVGRGQLHLTGEVLAKIFLSRILAWNSPEILEINPKLKLPAAPIRLVVRADGSGTTYHFADYLAKVSPDWASAMGVKSQFQWPSHVIAAKGSGEVVNSVKSTPGAVGYVDYNYVLDNNLNYVQLRNAAGLFVAPNPETFGSAVRSSDWYAKGDFSRGITNMPGAGSWPITMGTYALLPRVTSTPEGTLAALRFLIWGYINGDELARIAKFVPLPQLVQAKAYAEIAKIVDTQGNMLGLQVLSPK